MITSNLRVLLLPAPKNDKKNYFAANLKQFYRLRKDVNKLRANIKQLASYLGEASRGSV